MGLAALRDHEDRIRGIRRLQPRRDKQLTGTAKALLDQVVTRQLQANNAQHALSPSLRRDIQAGLKPQTTNCYAPCFIQWSNYCASVGAETMPAEPYTLASFLSSASDTNSTMEPTKKRVNAINYFHSIAGHPAPCQHPFVQHVIRGITNRLGCRNIPREPLSLTDLLSARAAARTGGESGLAFVADVSIVMQEAQLRWDDVADMRLGDIVWGTSAARLLVVDSKTDRLHQGHFATVAASSSADSAYRTLLRLIQQGIDRFAQYSPQTACSLLRELQQQQPRLPYQQPSLSSISTLPIHIREAAGRCSLPLENLPLLGAWPFERHPASLLTPLSYNKFLFHLKRLFQNRPHIGTHSMRRGGVTDKMGQGIEPRLVQWLGRWKTAEAFEGYVGSRANIAKAAEAIERARRAGAGAGGSVDAPAPWSRQRGASAQAKRR